MGSWGKKMQQHMKNILHLLDLLLGLLSVEQSLGTAFPLQSVMYCHWSQVDSALRRASVVVRAARAKSSGAVLCPWSRLPAADLSDSGAWEALRTAWNWGDLLQIWLISADREVEEWGHCHAALHTALGPNTLQTAVPAVPWHYWVWFSSCGMTSYRALRFKINKNQRQKQTQNPNSLSNPLQVQLNISHAKRNFHPSIRFIS